MMCKTTWRKLAGPAAVLVALLAGCDAREPTEASSAAEGAKAAPPAPSAGPASRVETRRDGAAFGSDRQEEPRSERQECRFEVDGNMLVDGGCDVFPMGNGGYTLNTWTNGKPRQSHFAVVAPLSDGTAEASWNADPDDDKAMDSLGIVTLKQGCWVNDRARICARW